MKERQSTDNFVFVFSKEIVTLVMKSPLNDLLPLGPVKECAFGLVIYILIPAIDIAWCQGTNIHKL